MKILCLLNSLGSGGAERQMSYLSSLLAEDNHEVTLCYYAKNNFNASFLNKKITLIYIPKKSIWYLCKLLAKLIRKEKPNIVISYLLYPNLYISIAKIIAMLPQTRLIVSERNFSVNGLNLKDYFLRFFPFITADFIVCNAQAQQRLLKHKFPLLKHKIKYIGNALNLALYQQKTTQNNEGVLKLIHPASFISSKNHLGLAKALLLLKEKDFLNLEIHCFGSCIERIVDGKKYKSKSYSELNDFIIKHDLSDNMILHEPIPDLFKYYNEYDGLILPSFYEGCPNAVMEGMASGLPIIAANVSDVAYLTEGEKGGILFNPHDINDISEKLLTFTRLTHKEWSIMSQHNRDRANDLFDFSLFLNKYYTLMCYKHE